MYRGPVRGQRGLFPRYVCPVPFASSRSAKSSRSCASTSSCCSPCTVLSSSSTRAFSSSDCPVPAAKPALVILTTVRPTIAATEMTAMTISARSGSMALFYAIKKGQLSRAGLEARARARLALLLARELIATAILPLDIPLFLFFLIHRTLLATGLTLLVLALTLLATRLTLLVLALTLLATRLTLLVLALTLLATGLPLLVLALTLLATLLTRSE